MDLSVTGVDAATNKFYVETIPFDLAFESMQNTNSNKFGAI